MVPTELARKCDPSLKLSSPTLSLSLSLSLYLLQHLHGRYLLLAFREDTLSSGLASSCVVLKDSESAARARYHCAVTYRGIDEFNTHRSRRANLRKRAEALTTEINATNYINALGKTKPSETDLRVLANGDDNNDAATMATARATPTHSPPRIVSPESVGAVALVPSPTTLSPSPTAAPIATAGVHPPGRFDALSPAVNRTPPAHSQLQTVQESSEPETETELLDDDATDDHAHRIHPVVKSNAAAVAVQPPRFPHDGAVDDDAAVTMDDDVESRPPAENLNRGGRRESQFKPPSDPPPPMLSHMFSLAGSTESSPSDPAPVVPAVVVLDQDTHNGDKVAHPRPSFV